MGLFCVNFHVRTRDSDAVITALHGRGFRQTRFAPSRGSEWISFYEAHASRQDDGRIQQVAESISDALQAPTIAFLVHDSDIACYWLYDDGTLLDAYNSCPDYFSDGPGGSEPEGGDADLLLPYCRPGTQAQHLTSILGEHTVFAEEVIQRLAEALGIEPMAALSDYRDTDEGGLGEWGAVDGLDDEEDSDDSDGPGADDVLPFSGVAAGNLLQEALDRGLPESSDPQVRALVRAAVEGDLTEIERLIAAGVDLDEAAPAPLLKGSHSKLSQFVPTANLQVPLTPLLAAIVHGHRNAALRLLDEGANPDLGHPAIGTALHVAAGNGDVELLKVLIDRGCDVNARNAQKQTPLQIIVASRSLLARLDQAKAMASSMGVNLPFMVEELAAAKPPVAGWAECESVLKESGAR